MSNHKTIAPSYPHESRPSSRGPVPHAARVSWSARTLRGVFVLLGAASLTCYGAYRVDRYALHVVAADLTQHLSKRSDKVLELNHWVHAHLPTKRNPDSFGWGRLRATPIQVLERGGDCADKSRLLSAMLRELGVPATMVMLFDQRTGLASHTVVEARVAADDYMVVDPSFELHYPDPSGDDFLGVIDLRRHPEALEQRLAQKQAVHPWPALCHFYPVTYATYQNATTINWNKNALTRAVRGLLLRWVGEELYRWPRPTAAEEPKLFFSLAALIIAVALYGCTQFVERLRRRAKRGVVFNHVEGTGSQMISDALKTGPSVQHSR